MPALHQDDASDVQTGPQGKSHPDMARLLASRTSTEVESADLAGTAPPSRPGLSIVAEGNLTCALPRQPLDRGCYPTRAPCSRRRFDRAGLSSSQALKPASAKNSCREAGQSLRPCSADMTVCEPVARTPHNDVHRCSAPTPMDATCSCSQSATCLVNRSWTCRSRAKVSKTRASLDNPRMRFPGRWPRGRRRALRRFT